MPHIRTKLKTEPLLSQVKSQFSKLLEELRLDKLEKTAKEDPRKILYAKLTTTMVVLELVKNVLLFHLAHQTSNHTKVETKVEIKEETKVLDLLNEIEVKIQLSDK